MATEYGNWDDGGTWCPKPSDFIVEFSEGSSEGPESIVNKLEKDKHRERLRRRLAREACYGRKFRK